ncbi:glypican-5-like [Pomacea canaliculata]|uniref:glypican-5-like n=1 Tax=Pomacea canaliculata TaxID=400727 RepID=UPI000D7385E3|nr:glypican-5-like [Pomacea canaliculata]
MAWQRIVPVCLLLVFASQRLSALSDTNPSPNFSCGQVRELFEGKIGSPASLLSNPEHEPESSICRRQSSELHLSCCTAHTEQKFGEAAEKKLKENLRSRNHALKKHITNTLAKYQDPGAGHQEAVTSFYSAIQRALQSGDTDGLEEIVKEFFRRLFPPVFDYVLSNQGQDEPRSSTHEYHECLQQYEKQIRPFRDVPDNLYRQLWKSFRHALLFQETLKTFTNTIASTESVSMETECRWALVRLQVCAGCRGQSLKGAEVRPCRGMCLNVMRGCLAKVSEISSSWDDLVVAFENLQLGAMGHYELQRLLMYMDMNVTDAIMLAMDDSPRIYDEESVEYEQDMQSSRCWNGTAVARYTQEVPEANFLSQQRHNSEVKVSLMPDYSLLQVKDTLTHMRRQSSCGINPRTVMKDGQPRAPEQDVHSHSNHYCHLNKGSVRTS